MDTNSTYKHWYELNPSRLEMEKMAMAALFPDFALMTIDDGTLRWSGFIVSESKHKYNVIVEYLNSDNGDVEPIVIPVLPDVNGLFCGVMVKFREIMTHAMCGSIGLLNLHSDDCDKSKLETAASTLKKAQVWFENYESEKRKVEEETISRDAAARKRQEIRDRLSRGAAVTISTRGSHPGSQNNIAINIEDHLIDFNIDSIRDKYDTGETSYCFYYINQESLDTSPAKVAAFIPFYCNLECTIDVPNAKIRFPAFEGYFRDTFECWNKIKEFQKLGSYLESPVNHLIDPNLFLKSFRKNHQVNIKGSLTKSIIRGTGLITSFDQDFYVDVDNLKFPYCQLEVFIVYTLKHLGLTFLNLSEAYDDYRFVYCYTMLRDVIKTSSYTPQVKSSTSENVEAVLTSCMPAGVYCYRNYKDNTIHIFHYLWDNVSLGEKGYYLREVTIRSKYKFDDEVSYSDLEFETNDTLITKFLINN